MNDQLFTAHPISLEQRLQQLEEVRNNLETEAAILQKSLISIEEIRKILLEDANLQILQLNQQQNLYSDGTTENIDNNIQQPGISDNADDITEQESDQIDDTTNINIQEFIQTDNEDDLDIEESELTNQIDELNIPDFGQLNDTDEIADEVDAAKEDSLLNETEIIKRIAEEQMKLLAEEEEKRRQQEEIMQKQLAQQQKEEETSIAAEIEAKLKEAIKAAEIAAADAGSITKQWLNNKTEIDKPETDTKTDDNQTIEAVQQLLKQISQQVNK